MLVRRKGSAKRKRGVYKAIEFGYDTSIQQTAKFLEGFGKVDISDEGWKYSIRIVLEDNRRVSPGQILLKDERKKKILTFDSTIFYEWFEQVNYGSGS